jgi:hypothetical protein
MIIYLADTCTLLDLIVYLLLLSLTSCTSKFKKIFTTLSLSTSLITNN